MARQTHIAIEGETFTINGELTYKGHHWNGHRIEGLLLNSRMVQGIFDDLNPETVSQWQYEDTDEWSAERNVSEFISAMPSWLAHGVLAFTINLQGGSPYGYSKAQPWINSAINPDGSLHPDYMTRLERIMDRADELGMVVILGIFYFGQEKVLDNEDAIKRAVDHVVEWLFEKDYRNVLIEINNECNVVYQQPILRPERVHELIIQAKSHKKDGRRFLVSTSYGGNFVARSNVVQNGDFVLLHGNGVTDPARIAEMVRQARVVDGYEPMPILFNEDDHFNFDQPMNNFVSAISEYASWGFFDYRMEGESYVEGYQSVPVDWGINSERKKGFFGLAKQMTRVDK